MAICKARIWAFGWRTKIQVWAPHRALPFLRCEVLCSAPGPGNRGADHYEGGQHPHFRLGGSASEVLLALAASSGLADADLMQIKKRAPEMSHHAAQDAAHYAWCAAAIQLMANGMPDEGIDRVVRQIGVRGAVRR